MKLPDRFHKGLLVEIVCRVALDFIEHEKDVHKDEEEDSDNVVSMLSSVEEK